MPSSLFKQTSKIVGSLLFLSLAQAPALADTPPKRTAAQPASQSGLDLKAIDKSVEPSQDFYQYANGGWLKSHPIPADKPRWGRFNILAESNQDKLHEILEQCAADKFKKPGSLEQKLGDFYSSGMDVESLRNQGLGPLRGDLEKIRGARDARALQAVVVDLHKRGIHPFFNFGATQDAKNSSLVIGEIRQGGLGLPEREYYLRADEKSSKQRKAYQAHLKETFHRLGYSAEAAGKKADAVFNLEKKMAEASLTNVELRDPVGTYHPTTVAGLSTGRSNWNWTEYFSSIGVSGGGETRMNLATPKFFEAFYDLFDSTDGEVLRAYLEWNLVRGSYDFLSDDWADFRFNFYGKVLTGTPAQTPRWRRVVRTVDGLMGEALGKKYVEKNFPPAAKARVQEMVSLLSEALDEDLATLTWMSPETQKQAKAKLAAFHSKIGYPDHWRDYSSLSISRSSFVENVWRAQSFEVARDLAKIGRPLDRTEWYMSPPTVNAYYDPQMNEIVFPAGITQPPFFSLEADDALNYGGLGAVIGHEITHGFDDQGRQYDGQGNLRDWWSPTDLQNFNKVAKLVEEQFSAYTVSDGLHVNGKLVLGESIADLGGLRLSYLAYQKLLKKKPGQIMDGFTPDQRFFLGYARIWAINLRPEYERLQVNTDPHPPARFRVNGPLSNMPEFRKAFNCPEGSPMVRTQPTLLW